jgi:Reverse transcriptase (RNA-dependent DNA polymerase)
MVALGYSQIAGVDFTGNFVPVVNDSTFRLVLLMISKLGLKGWSIDIGTAFLNGDLNEEIFMKLPEGYEEIKGEPNDSMCLKLNKSIYGLVQAAREWNHKFTSELLNLGFKINNVDPCLFHMEYNGKFCIICLYVDDMIITGDVGLMVKTIEGLRKVFHVKVQYTIKDFLGCNIVELPDEIDIYQLRIVQKLIKDVESLKEIKYKTPSAPGFKVVRPSEEEKVDSEVQKWFRATIGSLLYLVKLSRPDLCNAVRELSKVMDGANPGQVKELKRIVEFVSQTKDKGLLMHFRKEVPYEIEVYSDSDFAGDKDGRKSVSGTVVLVSGVPISWRSKGQNTVSLSSTEAEYIALSEAVREVKFISQICEVMHIEYKRPINVYVDNIGAIFLAGNRNSSDRSKHIDMKYHFVRDLIDEGLIDVKFVRSNENLADLFTKNLNGELYEAHSSKLLTA